ncbi:MAG TPA: DUF6807 family protein [Pseudolysinimonas sp.]|nr:DUF6807 family protein [Pseudolysinimonas sp.]
MSRLVALPAGDRRERIVASDGRHIADYSYTHRANHPFFSGLRPLGHDGVLTNHAPWDHPWHHGLWWAWKYLDDVLFWEDRDGFGGDRRALGAAVVVGHQTAHEGETLVISEDLEWRELPRGRILMTEQRTLRLREDAASRSWSIDWDHRFLSRDPVRLGTTAYPEHSWGGYAGLNYRPARPMAAGEEIRAARGLEGAERIHAQAVEWVSLTGYVDDSGLGDPDHPSSGGVILAGHPDNAWGERSAYAVSAGGKSFGFIALAPLMHGDRVLAAGEPLRLRYRSTVIGDRLGPGELAELASRFGDAE